MPKVIMPFNLQMLQRTGIDYSVCPKCREGKMEIVASYLNHNGTLINIKDLQKLKNKASPMRSILRIKSRILIPSLLTSQLNNKKIMKIKSARNQPVWVRETIIKSNTAMQKTHRSGIKFYCKAKPKCRNVLQILL